MAEDGGAVRAAHDSASRAAHDSAVRALADDLHALLMAADPFEASLLGVPGYDALVPDVSRGAAAEQTQALTALRARAAALSPRTSTERVVLTSVVHHVESRLSALAAATVECTVSTMTEGPSTVLLVSSQTRPGTLAAAADYLTRVRRLDSYVDGCAQRLREGLAAGRPPVRALVEVSLAQLDGYLATPVDAPDEPVCGVPGPPDWSEEPAWRDELRSAVHDAVRPAFTRYRDLLAAELLPAARADDACGLVHLPGGLADYERLIRVHTTLPLTAQELHDAGLAAVQDLVQQMTDLGAGLGLDDFPAVLRAARDASEQADPHVAITMAKQTIAKAEAVAPQWFPDPLPEPCAVVPMSEHLAAAGMPPMYFPPSPDGARPGSFLFNTVQPGAGSGWDLEATAFHEAVPGHHLQISRTLMQRELPGLLRESIVTAQAEGWGLYSEQLADEMGLYTSTEQLLGALVLRVVRAARLVVDTGIHALGWSRGRAVDYLQAHVPLPEDFLVSEVNRYVGWPGQALAYYTGYREILRLRERAAASLGDAFDLRTFHGVVLDAGSVPLPALATAVDAWLQEGLPPQE